MPEIPAPIPHTVDAIYRTYEARPQYERGYLGASSFGTECDRAFWYGFRWAAEPRAIDGKTLRLFQTGHREEERIIEELRTAGMEVQDRDPSTGGQWHVSALGGHMRGHLDGIVWGVPEAPRAEHVLEIKTHNEKSYRALVKDGVAASKPGHFAQMQLYMHLKGVSRALYVAVNKNTDELYSERVAYDAGVALRLLARAERTIRAETAPPRLHDDVTAKAAFACQWCPALAICHHDAFARRNCRTCLHSTPVVDGSDNGRWLCELSGEELSITEQRAGCAEHRYLPSLVPGEQIDASEKSVSYILRNGERWEDGHA